MLYRLPSRHLALIVARRIAGEWYRSAMFAPWARVAEIGSFIQNDDVAALATLLKQVARISLSPAKGNDPVMEQLTQTIRQVVFPFLERTFRRETESIYRQVVDIQKDSFRSPESIVEFLEQPA